MIYYVEFHNFEVAIISAVRKVSKVIPLVGIQQSAPNPTLLSFFFAPKMFYNDKNSYPLPNLLLCSANIYEELMIKNGLRNVQIKTVGFIAGKYMVPLCMTCEERVEKRKSIGVTSHMQMCLVACSINPALTEGIVSLLSRVVEKLANICFVLKGHPVSPIVNGLLGKYGIKDANNVRCVDISVSDLMPLSDFFISASTTVSQDALKYGVVQAHLDVGDLPYANPLHMIPGLIQDVENAEELIAFFEKSDHIQVREEDKRVFFGEDIADPCEEIYHAIRYHAQVVTG